jgi:hypothetical protein
MNHSQNKQESGRQKVQELGPGAGVPRRLRVIRWAHVISPNSERLLAACREESVNGRSARLGGSRVVLAFLWLDHTAGRPIVELPTTHAREQNRTRDPLSSNGKDLNNKLS